MQANVSLLRPQAKTGARTSSVTEHWITALSLLIALLAVAATAVGIFTFNNGQHVVFVALRGQSVTLQGAGLYAHESMSMAAQAVGQDIVTLVVGLPLLLIATYLAVKGSLRGKLLRVGVLGYFAYIYLIYAFGAAYNPFFLVYVAIFSASVFGLALSILVIDIRRLPAQFSARFARRGIALLMIFQAAFLVLMWLGRIVPSLISGSTPVGLESYTTLVVQAADLGLAVPLVLVAGITLLQRQAIGYMLSSVLVVYGAAFGLALIGMIIAMTLAGTAVIIPEVVGFSALALLFLIATVHVFGNLGARSPYDLTEINRSEPGRS